MKHKKRRRLDKKRLSRRAVGKIMMVSHSEKQVSDKYAIIYQSELDFISRCILDCKRIETGGQLFGFYTVSGNPVICYAIGPGKQANHQTTFFNQDLNYLETVGKRLVDDFALQHIGEWHSHHQLGLAHPSGHDAANIRGNVDKLGLSQFLLCIGVCDSQSSTLNAFDFEAGKVGYQDIKWMIKSEDSPYRSAVDKKLGEMIMHPITQAGNMRNLKTVSNRPAYARQYWLNEKGNDAVLKSIYDCVSTEWGTTPKVMLDGEKCVHLVFTQDREEVDVCFGKGFPREAPAVKINGTLAAKESQWEYNGNIVIATMQFLKRRQ